MADRRQELFTLFRNAASLVRPEAYAFVGNRLQAALGGSGGGAVPWQDVEVTVSLLYQLGEGAPEADVKPGSGVLAQLAAGIMATEVPAAKHRLVALALLETYVRYSRVLAAGGGAALAAVVARFLDQRGMGHPCEAVSKRAAYLFCRLAKQLRGQLRPLVPDILQVCCVWAPGWCATMWSAVVLRLRLGHLDGMPAAAVPCDRRLCCSAWSRRPGLPCPQPP